MRIRCIRDLRVLEEQHTFTVGSTVLLFSLYSFLVFHRLHLTTATLVNSRLLPPRAHSPPQTNQTYHTSSRALTTADQTHIHTRSLRGNPHTPTMTNTPPNPTDLSLPRILCLHGGGVTAEIFQLQARSLIKALPTFRLVFADGPFYCPPGPGIVPVYEDYGPFRRWLRWLPEHADIDDEAAIEEVMYAIETCKSGDPGTGPWVGLMGFSQGAKLAASLLYDQQVREEKIGVAETAYKFAVLLAGRQPLMQLSEYSVGPATLGAGEISEGFRYEGPNEHVLRLPTIHVHGLNDAGLHLHRDLMRKYCHPESVTLVEWDGTHRVPLKKTDVDKICTEIYRVAKEQGVRC